MKKVKNLFIKDYKKVMLLVILVILFCGSFLYTNNSKAVTDLGNYISIKLDTNDLLNDQLWEFQSVSGNHNFFDVTTTSYTPGATTYDCALFLVEEWGGSNPDKPYIVWTENEVVLTAVDGNSLSSDIGGNYVNCCVVTSLGGPCASSSCLGWNAGPAGPLDVFLRAYSTGWTDKCSGSDCALSSSDTHYRPDTEILCETTWKQCGAAETSCNSYGGRAYACNSGFWDRCTGTTPICSAGACVAASGLSLSVSASATTISTSGTSNITFTVKNGATLISGATVGIISVVGGKVDGSATTTCTTGASGTCIVVYTAPTAVGLYTINAQKATKTGFTASGSVSIGITVNACLASSSINFSSGSYTLGGTITLSGTDTAKDFAICIYNPSGSRRAYNDLNTAGSSVSATYVSNAVGPWTGTIELGVAPTCPLTLVAASDCLDTTTVSAAATPTPTPGPGSCPSTLSCTTTIVAGDVGCACGTATATAANIGDHCCALSNAFYSTLALCNASPCGGAAAGCIIGTCNGVQYCPVAGGAWANCPVAGETCGVGGICSAAGCVVGVCSGVQYCPVAGGAWANCPVAGETCIAGICGVATPPGTPCGGAGMFVSPLGPGYCTIGEILANATNWILSLVASVIILIIIIGGLMYISSTGDEEKLRTSKNVIFYAIVGLGIILISAALIAEVTALLKG